MSILATLISIWFVGGVLALVIDKLAGGVSMNWGVTNPNDPASEKIRRENFWFTFNSGFLMVTAFGISITGLVITEFYKWGLKQILYYRIQYRRYKNRREREAFNNWKEGVRRKLYENR